MSTEICKYCTDPTKRIAAFIEKENGSSDHKFICDNLECYLRLQIEDEFSNTQSIKEEVKKTNKDDGINMEGLRKLRVESCVLIYDITKAIGVSTPQYSAYENHYQPIPKVLYGNIIEFIKLKAIERGINDWERFGL